MRTLIENLEFVVTADPDGRVLRNASVAIEDDCIAEIGRGAMGKRSSFDEIIDGSRFGMTPGFIDSHVHLGETLSRGVFPDRLPLSWEFRSRYFEGREGYLRSLYLGISSLGLVLAGVAGRRRRPWLFFLSITVIATLLALGRHTRFYGVALAALPPLKILRFPAKAMVLTAFAWAMLAGIGFDAWRSGERGRFGRIGAASLLAMGGVVAGGLALLAHGHAEEWGSALLFLGGSARSFTQVLAPTARQLTGAAAFALAMAIAVMARGRDASSARPLAGFAALLLVADLV